MSPDDATDLRTLLDRELDDLSFGGAPVDAITKRGRWLRLRHRLVSAGTALALAGVASVVTVAANQSRQSQARTATISAASLPQPPFGGGSERWLTNSTGVASGAPWHSYVLPYQPLRYLPPSIRAGMPRSAKQVYCLDIEFGVYRGLGAICHDDGYRPTAANPVTFEMYGSHASTPDYIEFCYGMAAGDIARLDVVFDDGAIWHVQLLRIDGLNYFAYAVAAPDGSSDLAQWRAYDAQGHLLTVKDY
jgi:hypothetical protein